MKFIPLNHHLEIKPIKQDNFIPSSDTTYEEKGEVMSVAKEVPETFVKVGDIVYFDSYLCAKFPDETGAVRYLIETDAIRAKETNED